MHAHRSPSAPGLHVFFICAEEDETHWFSANELRGKVNLHLHLLHVSVSQVRLRLVHLCVPDQSSSL